MLAPLSVCQFIFMASSRCFIHTTQGCQCRSTKNFHSTRRRLQPGCCGAVSELVLPGNCLTQLPVALVGKFALGRGFCFCFFRFKLGCFVLYNLNFASIASHPAAFCCAKIGNAALPKWADGKARQSLGDSGFGTYLHVLFTEAAEFSKSIWKWSRSYLTPQSSVSSSGRSLSRPGFAPNFAAAISPRT